MSGYHNRFFDNKMAFRANMMITGGFLTLLSWNLRVNYAKRTTFLIHFGVFFEMGSKMDHVVHPRRVCVNSTTFQNLFQTFSTKLFWARFRLK